MRQAGRYLPEYRAVRAKVDFLTLCKTPDLAAEVTIQPVDILGVDAAIIFSDILVLLEAMGMPLHFDKGGGPKIPKTIRAATDIEALHAPDIAKDLGYVGAAIRKVHQALAPRGVPVLGFAGAPLTLACYAIEGETSREFNKTKKFLAEHPGPFRALLQKLAEGVVLHLRAQIEAGANAVQIFDSWAGILGQKAYREHILPSLQAIVSELKPLGAPVILYANGSAPHLEAMAASGADVLSVDWRLPLSEVRHRVGNNVALQGNLDPTLLYSSIPEIQRLTHAMLAEHPGPGYIANLGHGMLPDLPVANALAFVNAVKNNF